MADLVPSNHARSAVQAFLASEAAFVKNGETKVAEVNDSSEGEEDFLQAKSRPSRLGLGASFDARVQKRDLSESERRIAGSVRASKERENSRAADGDDARPNYNSDDGDNQDSRAAFLTAKIRMSDPRKQDEQDNIGEKSNLESLAEDSVSRDGDLKPPGRSDFEQSEVCGSESIVSEDADTSLRHEGRSRELFGSTRKPSTSDPSSLGERQRTTLVSGKRKKTRSRQKNLRRDKRPKESLPPHLTAETLKQRLKPGSKSRETTNVDQDREATSSRWLVDRTRLDVLQG